MRMAGEDGRMFAAGSMQLHAGKGDAASLSVAVEGRQPCLSRTPMAVLPGVDMPLS